MSWHFSRALGEAFSEANSLGGNACVLLKSSTTGAASSCGDSQTEYYIHFQYGMTSAPSTAGRGAELLMWYLAGFPARTLAVPERAPESQASEAVYGWKWPESLARYDLASCSWKIRPFSRRVDSGLFSATWPRWGIMRDGECCQQQTPSGIKELRASIISGSESGFSLTTPCGSDTGLRKNKYSQGGTALSLQAQSLARRLPTANQRDWKDTGPSQGRRKSPNRGSVIYRLPTATKCGNHNRKGASKKSGDGLSTAVKRMPTACAKSKKGGRMGLDGGAGARAMMTTEECQELTGGSLNPAWLEWFMGFPIGWTELEPLATPSFLKWLSLHGKHLAPDFYPTSGET